jgi:transposase
MQNQLHRTRDVECAARSNDLHEMSALDKLELMSDSPDPFITFIRQYSQEGEMEPVERYVGLDIHKRHVVVAAVDSQQRMIVTPQKVAVERFEGWARQHLRPTDHVALEATTNSWEFYDQLAPTVAEVAVANCFQLRLISASSRKTDRHDALVVAKLFAAKLLPEVWVPPQHVRDLRTLTSHRAQLIGEKTSIRNRLHNLLHRHNLALPTGNPFNIASESWWKALPLSEVERLQVRHFWLSLHHVTQLIQETEAQIAQLSVAQPWDGLMTFLLQLPGVGLYTGMTILAAIGDIGRFASPEQLVGYAGLGARIRASGDVQRTGKISKLGRRELRTALVAVAWSAVRWSSHWRNLFQSLSKRLGKPKAITAIARKILVVIWHILTKHELDIHANPTAIARSFMTWSSQHHLARSQAKHRLDFVRQRLAQLGILDQVSSFRANGRVHAFVT